MTKRRLFEIVEGSILIALALCSSQIIVRCIETLAMALRIVVSNPPFEAVHRILQKQSSGLTGYWSLKLICFVLGLLFLLQALRFWRVLRASRSGLVFLFFSGVFFGILVLSTFWQFAAVRVVGFFFVLSWMFLYVYSLALLAFEGILAVFGFSHEIRRICDSDIHMFGITCNPNKGLNMRGVKARWSYSTAGALFLLTLTGLIFITPFDGMARLWLGFFGFSSSALFILAGMLTKHNQNSESCK